MGNTVGVSKLDVGPGRQQQLVVVAGDSSGPASPRDENHMRATIVQRAVDVSATVLPHSYPPVHFGGVVSCDTLDALSSAGAPHNAHEVATLDVAGPTTTLWHIESALGGVTCAKPRQPNHMMPFSTGTAPSSVGDLQSLCEEDMLITPRNEAGVAIRCGSEGGGVHRRLWRAGGGAVTVHVSVSAVASPTSTVISKGVLYLQTHKDVLSGGSLRSDMTELLLE